MKHGTPRSEVEEKPWSLLRRCVARRQSKLIEEVAAFSTLRSHRRQARVRTSSSSWKRFFSRSPTGSSTTWMPSRDAPIDLSCACSSRHFLSRGAVHRRDCVSHRLMSWLRSSAASTASTWWNTNYSTLLTQRVRKFVRREMMYRNDVQIHVVALESVAACCGRKSHHRDERAGMAQR